MKPVDGRISKGLFKDNKLLIVIIVAALAVIIIVSAVIVLLNSDYFDRTVAEPYPALGEDELAETKEEGFDIMEYDRYLNCNRVVMLEDSNGVSQSINDATYKNYGKGVALTYELLKAVIAGDADAYNSMVTEEVGHYESFTQQQLYDMKITRVSQETVQGKNGNYDEYVLEVEFKIRENNGSFKNNLPSDTSRPFTMVLNDSSGELLVVSISEPVYIKK